MKSTYERLFDLVTDDQYLEEGKRWEAAKKHAGKIALATALAAGGTAALVGGTGDEKPSEPAKPAVTRTQVRPLQRQWKMGDKPISLGGPQNKHISNLELNVHRHGPRAGQWTAYAKKQGVGAAPPAKAEERKKDESIMNNTYNRLLELVLNDGRTDEAGAKRLARKTAAELKKSGASDTAIKQAKEGEYSVRQAMRGKPTDTKELRGREPKWHGGWLRPGGGDPDYQETQRTADVKQIRAKAQHSDKPDPLAAKEPGSVGSQADFTRPSRMRGKMIRAVFSDPKVKKKALGPGFIQRKTPL